MRMVAVGLLAVCAGAVPAGAGDPPSLSFGLRLQGWYLGEERIVAVSVAVDRQAGLPLGPGALTLEGSWPDASALTIQVTAGF